MFGVQSGRGVKEEVSFVVGTCQSDLRTLFAGCKGENTKAVRDNSVKHRA